jgi:hypothetical protein
VARLSKTLRLLRFVRLARMHFGAIALGGVWPLGSLGMFVSEKKGISSSHENKPWFTNFHITSLILFFEGFFPVWGYI